MIKTDERDHRNGGKSHENEIRVSRQHGTKP